MSAPQLSTKVCEADDHGKSCGRPAARLVEGQLLCWKHARRRQLDDAAAYAEIESHLQDEIRERAPFTTERHWTVSLLWKVRPNGNWTTCVVCGHLSRTRKIYTNPLWLRRMYVPVCKRRRCSTAISDWEKDAEARRRRAHYDWEREHPSVEPLPMWYHLAPQYPSVSRATLRSFLDSGADVATLDAGPETISALNGSIKALGFAAEVFAEQRSNRAVLRRIPADDAS